MQQSKVTFLFRHAKTISIATSYPTKFVNVMICVNAPLFEEFAMSMECEMVKYDDEMELLYGRIKNLGADESVLDEKGNLFLEEMGRTGCCVFVDNRDWQEIRREHTSYISYRLRRT